VRQTLVSVRKNGDDEVDQEHHVDEYDDKVKNFADVFSQKEVFIDG
jgi:hypothetical protein